MIPHSRPALLLLSILVSAPCPPQPLQPAFLPHHRPTYITRPATGHHLEQVLRCPSHGVSFTGSALRLLKFRSAQSQAPGMARKQYDGRFKVKKDRAHPSLNSKQLQIGVCRMMDSFYMQERTASVETEMYLGMPPAPPLPAFPFTGLTPLWNVFHLYCSLCCFVSVSS